MVLIISIDLGYINYALRIERRYDDGQIITLEFDEGSILDCLDEENTNRCLLKYCRFYNGCDFIIIERQSSHDNEVDRICQYYTSKVSPSFNPRVIVIGG